MQVGGMGQQGGVRPAPNCGSALVQTWICVRLLRISHRSLRQCFGWVSPQTTWRSHASGTRKTDARGLHHSLMDGEQNVQDSTSRAAVLQ